MNPSSFVPLLGFCLGLAAMSLPLGGEIEVPVGGGRGPLMMSGLGPSEAATGLPEAEIADGRRDFYFRQIGAATSEVLIPLRPRGPFSLAMRTDTTVRTRVDVLGEGGLLAREFVPIGPWRESRIAPILRMEVVAFTLQFTDAPLVGRSDPERFRRYVDEFVLLSEAGFDFPWASRIAGGLLVLLLALLARPISRAAEGAAGLLAGPMLLSILGQLEPVALSLALPRLVGVMAGCALAVLALGRRLSIAPKMNASLALLGSGMVLAYGYFSFLPDHSPPDLDIHIWRTIDLPEVPPTYEGWLRYGSHYPTVSQSRGAATDALGGGPPIPYSPLPYVVFYAVSRAGLDLHWSMNAIEAVSLALLLPLIYAFARAASSSWGGLLAAAFMATDLATIHRLGRAHAPAVVGGALGIAALLAFGLALPGMGRPGGWRIPGLLLGLGALGYSSTPLFYALCGVALIALLTLLPETRRLIPSVALALAAGGATAVLLFYGHFLPGFLRQGLDASIMADPFPGRTFFVFHNESRQSLRLWRLGLFIPYLAAIPAALLVIARCVPVVWTFLLAWVTAWAGVMLLKEPWAFPRLLRWAKEDFYVAPGLALLIAIGIARIESRPLRLGLALLGLVTSVWLRAQDYGFHADTLRFLQ